MKDRNSGSQTEAYYFVTYRSHPHSDQSFSYIDSFGYYQSSHHAYQSLNHRTELLQDPAASEYDLGVGMTIPVNHLVRSHFEVDTLDGVRKLDDQDVKVQLQSELPIFTQ